MDDFRKGSNEWGSKARKEENPKCRAKLAREVPKLLEDAMAVDKRGGPRAGAGRPKGPQPPTERFTLRARPSDVLALKTLAEAKGLTPSELGGKVLSEWLELERLGWTEKVR